MGTKLFHYRCRGRDASEDKNFNQEFENLRDGAMSILRDETLESDWRNYLEHIYFEHEKPISIFTFAVDYRPLNEGEQKERKIGAPCLFQDSIEHMAWSDVVAHESLKDPRRFGPCKPLY